MMQPSNNIFRERLQLPLPLTLSQRNDSGGPRRFVPTSRQGNHRFNFSLCHLPQAPMSGCSLLSNGVRFVGRTFSQTLLQERSVKQLPVQPDKRQRACGTCTQLIEVEQTFPSTASTCHKPFVFCLVAREVALRCALGATFAKTFSRQIELHCSTANNHSLALVEDDTERS